VIIQQRRIKMALSANELRIGNLVWDDYSGEMIVSAILESSAVYLRKTIALPSGEYLVKYIKPIPLNEEWFLKFGFEKLNRDILEYKKDKLIVEWLFNRWTGRLYYDAYTSIQIIEINFVHELQNLYFALTGNELEIK
jgi:agmatine/peptidylarginine deiminase